MRGVFTLFIFILIAAFPAIAQNNKNILKYMDDVGIAKSKYMGKLSLTSLYEGEIGLSVERLVTDYMSIEAGVGLLLPYYKDPILRNLLTNSNPEDFTFDNPKTGYSFMVNPRYYTNDYSEGFYCSLPLRYKIYPGQLHLFDFSGNIGMQWVWDYGLVLDISAGIGGVLQMSKDNKSYIFDAGNKTDIDWEDYGIEPGDGIENSEPSKFRTLFPASVKIGYRFKSK